MNKQFTDQWLSSLLESHKDRVLDGECPHCAAHEIVEENSTALLADALKAAGDKPEALLEYILFNYHVLTAQLHLWDAAGEAVCQMFPELSQADAEDEEAYQPFEC